MRSNTATLFFLLILFFVSCGKKNTNQQLAQQQAPQLKVAELLAQDVTVHNSYAASIEGEQNVEIWPKVSGFVQEIYVEEGQKVRKGQPLFKLETQTLNQDARAAEAAVQVARVEVDKLIPLVEKGIISNVQLQTAKAQLQQAQSGYESVAANIGYSRITSPVDGYIGSLPYKTGALVSSTMQQPLTVVANITKVRAYFALNEKQLLAFKKQYPVDSLPKVELIMINGDAYDKKGTIAVVNTIINSATGSVDARADFENPDGLLSSGSTGQIRIPATFSNALVIPQTATVDLQGNKMVYILQEDNTVKATPIDIAFRTERDFIVTKGIDPGTTIVTEGVSKLRDGQAIAPQK
jgi:membrane fusion protein (multidrug efflux system)